MGAGCFDDVIDYVKSFGLVFFDLFLLVLYSMRMLCLIRAILTCCLVFMGRNILCLVCHFFVLSHYISLNWC